MRGLHRRGPLRPPLTANRSRADPCCRCAKDQVIINDNDPGNLVPAPVAQGQTVGAFQFQNVFLRWSLATEAMIFLTWRPVGSTAAHYGSTAP